MKTLKRKSVTLIVLFVLTVFGFSLHAQEKDQYIKMEQNKEKIEAQKVAFITNKLDLSVEEAEKFWPVYNNYKGSQKSKQKAWRAEHDFTSDEITKMTDSEADELAKAQMGHEQEMLDLRKGLISNMKGVISPQKILMLLEAEKDFRVELMRKMSHGRGTGVGRSEERR